jgi:hypothetical protein
MQGLSISVTALVRVLLPCIFLVCVTDAATIAVINPGFEDDPLNSGPLSDGEFCNFNCDDFPGWGITVNSWIANPLATQAVLPSGNGDQLLVAFFNAGGLQNVDALYQATDYRLTVDIGDRLDMGFAGGHIALYADRPTDPAGAVGGGRGGVGTVIGLLNFDNTFVTTNGGWGELSLDITAQDVMDATCGMVGQNCLGWRIQIGLFTLGSSVTQTLFDNVRLEAVPVPAAVWLFGSALGLLGWMRRRKTH